MNPFFSSALASGIWVGGRSAGLLIPGLDRAQVQRIIAEAGETCPFCKALRGDNSVRLVTD